MLEQMRYRSELSRIDFIELYGSIVSKLFFMELSSKQKFHQLAAN